MKSKTSNITLPAIGTTMMPDAAYDIAAAIRCSPNSNIIFLGADAAAQLRRFKNQKFHELRREFNES